MHFKLAVHLSNRAQKNCYFRIGFYFFGKSIQKHPYSVCENDVNNEQNVRVCNGRVFALL